MDQYILGSVFATLLGILAVYVFFFKKSGGRKEDEVEASTTTTTNIDGECRSAEASDDADIIIVGAGVAGAALAYTLGKDGRRVRVIERDLTEPDRIVGELLQPGGYLKLMELELEDCVEEIDAQRVFGYALFKDGKNVEIQGKTEMNIEIQKQRRMSGKESFISSQLQSLNTLIYKGV